MNLYFWFFAVCAFAMTPVEIEALVRLDRTVRWKIRLRFAGLPVLRKRQKEKHEKNLQTGRLIRALFSPGGRFLRSLIREEALQWFLRAFRWQSAQVYARLSFADAANTALAYSLIRTLLETLGRLGVVPGGITGRVEADFHALGTKVDLRGIFSARLGTLLVAGIRLGLAALRVRARLALEEETYAASH